MNHTRTGKHSLVYKIFKKYNIKKFDFFFKINIFKKKDLKTRHRLDNLDDDESLSLKDGSSSFKQDDVDSVISSSVVSNPKIKKTQAIYPIKSASSKINLLDNSSRPRRGNNGIATLNFHLCILVYLYLFLIFR